MTERHTDRIYRMLLRDEPLSRDDERHVATCADCQRAAAQAAHLDEHLRTAVAPLASEPLPDGLLDLRHDEVSAAGSRFVPALTATAAVVVTVGLTVGLIQLGPPSASVPSAAPSPSAEVSIAPESPDPTPAAPTPQPTQAPGEASDPYVVRAGERCADGDGGFSIVVPDGWAANRRGGGQPACQVIGPDRGARGNVEPRIYLGVHDEVPGLPEGADVTSEDRVELANGAVLTRQVVHAPETGALAAVDEVRYVASLLPPVEGGPGGVLVASTDPRDAGNVAALDSTMQTLELQPTMAAEPAAVEEVANLYRDRDVCLDDVNGWSVIFPDAWWTNTAVDDLDACSFFAPDFFELDPSGDVPEQVEVSLSVVVGQDGSTGEVLATETLTVMQRPAVRRVVIEGDDRRYEYVVELGEEAGHAVLLGRTHAEADADQPLANALLDAIIERVARGEPPPGAASSEPPIDAPPVADVAASGDFRLELVVEQDRYRAGQPIMADATLAYLGTEPSVVVLGSSQPGIVGTSVRQVDGGFDQRAAFTTDCAPHEILRDRPMHVAFRKHGGFSDDDPFADFAEAYFADPLLRLPPGRWEVVAGASFYTGAGDCGQGELIELNVSVEIVVEP